MQLNYVELFAGVGGFSLGIKRAGVPWRLVWWNQYEPKRKSQTAADIFREHFGQRLDVDGNDTNNCDIYAVKKSKIPSFDLLVGGFPCQDYSVANANAKGLTGSKDALFWQIIETLETKRPRFILLENVDRLLRSPKPSRGSDWLAILRALDAAGYCIEWSVLNAANYGEPQKRKRLYIFGYRKEQKLNTIEKYIQDQNGVFKAFPCSFVAVHFARFRPPAFNFNERGLMVDGEIVTIKTGERGNVAAPPLASILETNVAPRYYITEVDRWRKKKAGKPLGLFTTKNGETFKYTEGALAFPDPIDKPARTILTGEGSLLRTTHVIKDPETERLRTLTPLECERLQAFDDNWTINAPESNRRFLMGNAVNVNIIKQIATAIDSFISG